VKQSGTEFCSIIRELAKERIWQLVLSEIWLLFSVSNETFSDSEKNNDL
jgi:hypothetical protein